MTTAPTAVTVPELAALLGLSRTNVHYWLKRAGVVLHRDSGRYFALDTEVSAILTAVREAQNIGGGVSVKAAAARLDVEPSTVYTLIRLGRLDAFRVGRRVSVAQESVDRYLAERGR